MSDEFDAGKVNEESKLAAEGATSDEKVGYRRPPRHTRFKPGKSGNPQGRPKGRQSFRSAVTAALDALVVGNKTKQQMLAEKLVSDALAGKDLAMKIVSSIALSIGNSEGYGEGEADELQQRLLEDFSRRQETNKTAEATSGGDHDLS